MESLIERKVNHFKKTLKSSALDFFLYENSKHKIFSYELHDR